MNGSIWVHLSDGKSACYESIKNIRSLMVLYCDDSGDDRLLFFRKYDRLLKRFVITCYIILWQVLKSRPLSDT